MPLVESHPGLLVPTFLFPLVPGVDPERGGGGGGGCNGMWPLVSREHECWCLNVLNAPVIFVPL